MLLTELQSDTGLFTTVPVPLQPLRWHIRRPGQSILVAAIRDYCVVVYYGIYSVHELRELAELAAACNALSFTFEKPKNLTDDSTGSNKDTQPVPTGHPVNEGT